MIFYLISFYLFIALFDFPMSDTEEETLDLTKVLTNLENGAADAIESGDFLSYSTLVDIYLTETTVDFPHEEREQVLAKLRDVLVANPQLTYEIGWDLPEVLIGCLESDYLFEKGIRGAPFVVTVFKIFEVLATDGNPKELFLKACELISGITAEGAGTASDDAFIKEKYFDLKLYCLFQLIESCLRSIATLYPSKFLAMAVAAFINLAYRTSKNTVSDTEFLLKRFYGFARNYTTPPRPNPLPDMSTEELARITNDEQYLQGRLLSSFITHSVFIIGKRHLWGFTLDYFSNLQRSHRNSGGKYVNFRVTRPIMDRISELALLFDIDPPSVFEEFVLGARTLIGKTKHVKHKPESSSLGTSPTEEDLTDAFSAHLFESVVRDYQETVAHSVTNSDAREIKNSLLGILSIHTYVVSRDRDYTAKFSIYDAIVLTLRLTIPAMINQNFVNKGAFDVCVFWLWYALSSSKNASVEVSSVSPLLLTIYYQLLLFIYMNMQKETAFSLAALTLFSRVVAILPEQVSYAFLKDSLHNCPYDSIKAVLVGVLKELFVKPREDRVEKEEKEKEEKEKKEAEKPSEKKDSKEKIGSMPPPLPRRESRPNTFYTLTEDKFTDVVDLATLATELTFVDDDGQVLVNPVSFSTLSAYLNLFVALKNVPVVALRKKDVEKVLERVEANLQKVKAKYDKTEKLFEYNAVGLLDITIERIRE